MSDIVKSNNEKGNQYHKGKGSPDGGQFTSANGASFSNNNTNKRRHIDNPAYEPLYHIMYEVETDNFGEYNKAFKEAEAKFDIAAVSMIMKDTGFDEKQAIECQRSLKRYCGGLYEDFANGKMPKDVEIIDSLIHKMPKYPGEIVRGIGFNSAIASDTQKFANFVENLKEGREITVKNTPSSWTSDEDVGWDFAKQEFPFYHTILFVCSNNKSGASINHLSKFDGEESEVLVPSNTSYRVKRVITENKDARRNTKTIVCFLEEI